MLYICTNFSFAFQIKAKEFERFSKFCMTKHIYPSFKTYTLAVPNFGNYIHIPLAISMIKDNIRILRKGFDIVIILLIYMNLFFFLEIFSMKIH